SARSVSPLDSDFLTRLRSFFFLSRAAPTDTYTLSLHDALPILCAVQFHLRLRQRFWAWRQRVHRHKGFVSMGFQALQHLLVTKRSEEHTSELQSQSNLVCRLLLEKNKARTRGAGLRRLGTREQS